jgi:hypothetical protein
MHIAAERGVPQEERKIASAGLTDWDAARIFLEVVRRGSFRSAADRLGLSINAVRRRIERQTGAYQRPHPESAADDRLVDRGLQSREVPVVPRRTDPSTGTQGGVYGRTPDPFIRGLFNRRTVTPE